MLNQTHAAHRVRRPQWTCVADGTDWPCPPAREAMARAFGADSAALSMLMAYLMGLAAAELDQADPARLYRRFLGWLLDADHRCPACGRRGHIPMPGAPPRLCPCDHLQDAAAGRLRQGARES